MNQTQKNDQLLLTALKKGDHDAFVCIYEEFWESLYAIGFNRLQSRSDVEDIIQELFTELWNNRASIQIRDSLRVYLFTAMKYKVIDHIRKRKVDTVSLDHIKPNHRLSVNSTDQTLSFAELYDKLKEGIEQLPQQCKLVFKMSRELDMSSTEIAKELNVSRRTVETQIYKSLKHLKKSLIDYSSLFILSILMALL